MATFAIKCPHCLRENTSFTVVATQRHDARIGNQNVRAQVPVEVFATCNACRKGVSGTVTVEYPSVTHELEKISAAIDTNPLIKVDAWLPRTPSIEIPDHLPAVVERAFREAESLKFAGFRGPAGNAYRRALEAALKEVDPELKGSLFSRIEALANSSRLTANMKAFAHRIRTLGNEASHETPVVEDDEIDDLAIFTKLFLMYEFTLPGMLPNKDGDV